MQRGPGRKRARPLQAVLKFADVARPVVSQHRLQSVVTENSFLSRCPRQPLQEMRRKNRDVLPPFP